LSTQPKFHARRLYVNMRCLPTLVTPRCLFVSNANKQVEWAFFVADWQTLRHALSLTTAKLPPPHNNNIGRRAGSRSSGNPLSAPRYACCISRPPICCLCVVCLGISLIHVACGCSRPSSPSPSPPPPPPCPVVGIFSQPALRTSVLIIS
jgi:hypothetical protein